MTDSGMNLHKEQIQLNNVNNVNNVLYFRKFLFPPPQKKVLRYSNCKYQVLLVIELYINYIFFSVKR